MAVYMRLESEMPPVLLPPYELGPATPVSEILQAACAFFRQDPVKARLWNAVTGAEIPVDERPLGEHGLGEGALLTLSLTAERPYRRTSFG